MLRRNDFVQDSDTHGKSSCRERPRRAMRLLFEEQAVGELQNFIRHYEEAFFELYRDSGVWNEELIIQSYRESATRLYIAILEEIESRLSRQKVLGRKTAEHWKELAFHVGERLIIVRYSEDLKRKIRWIESIAIDRKPIIF